MTHEEYNDSLCGSDLNCCCHMRPFSVLVSHSLHPYDEPTDNYIHLSARCFSFMAHTVHISFTSTASNVNRKNIHEMCLVWVVNHPRSGQGGENYWFKTILHRRVGQSSSTATWKTHCQLSQTVDCCFCRHRWHNQLLGLKGKCFFSHIDAFISAFST